MPYRHGMTSNAAAPQPTPPVPPGALDVGDWGRDPAGNWSRWVTWRRFADGDVQVDGHQSGDGVVTAGISLWAGDGEQLDPARARRIAAALLDADDALDSLTGHRS